MPITILVCGHVTMDRAGGLLLPGGSAYYAARALAAMGARPRVFTAAGPEFPATALAGIEAAVSPSPATTTFENTYATGGARTQRVLQAAPPLDLSRLPAGWRRPDAVLVAPVLGECDPAAVRAAVEAPVAAVCVQGLVRAVAPDGSVVPRRLETRRLAGIDAAFLGDDDVRGQPDLLAELAAAVPIVAFTHGAHGCDLFAAEGRWRVGVHPAHEVDPTGAGDVFAAAFLLALARRDDPLAAARLAAAAGSIAVEGRGGEALDRAGEAFGRAPLVEVEQA